MDYLSMSDYTPFVVWAAIIACTAISITVVAKINMSLSDKIHFAYARKIASWLFVSCENLADLVSTLAFLFFVFRFVVQAVLPGMDRHIFDIPTIIAMLGIGFVPELLLVKTIFEFRELGRLAESGKKGVVFWRNIYAINAFNFSVITIITVVQIIAAISSIQLYPIIDASALGYRIVAVILFTVSTKLFEVENGVGFSKDIQSLKVTLAEQKELLSAATKQIIQLDETVKSLRLEGVNLRNERDNYRQQVEHKTSLLDVKTGEIERQKSLLDEYERQNAKLQREVKKADGDALEAYSEECRNWLRSGIKTATVEDIVKHTGHSKRKILNAKLPVSTRNKELIVVASLIPWLQDNPPLAARSEDRNTDNILVFEQTVERPITTEASYA
jgi:hypothetical protein